MSDLLTYDRLTPSRARQIAEAMSNDPKNASGLIQATISSLAELIPETGSFPAHLIEEALLKAAATQKIFKLAGSDELDHFASQRSPHSLLEYVFFAAVQGKTLREIVEGIPARCRSNQRRELWIDAGKFNSGKLYNEAASKALRLLKRPSGLIDPPPPADPRFRIQHREPAGLEDFLLRSAARCAPSS